MPLPLCPFLCTISSVLSFLCVSFCGALWVPSHVPFAVLLAKSFGPFPVCFVLSLYLCPICDLFYVPLLQLLFIITSSYLYILLDPFIYVPSSVSCYTCPFLFATVFCFVPLPLSVLPWAPSSLTYPLDLFIYAPSLVPFSCAACYVSLPPYILL